MKLIPTLFLSTLITASSCALSAATPQDPVVSLKDSLMPSAIKSVAAGSVDILGTTKAADATPIRVRVTSSIGTTFLTRVDAKDGRFVCHFPQDFPGAPALTPMLLYVDATDAAEFGEAAASHDAEALLIVAGTHNTPPDLPLIFMDDLLDVNGHADAESVQWPRTRTLVNLFMHSRAAHLMKINRPNFDLNTPADFAWFKDHATLYDFDHRDRDWSRPLGHRVARGYWRAVWSTWFNASNERPGGWQRRQSRAEQFSAVHLHQRCGRSPRVVSDAARRRARCRRQSPRSQ